MSEQKTGSTGRKKTWLIVIGVVFCVGCLCICIISLGGALLLREDLPDWFSGKSAGRLEISSVSVNGDVSGVYLLDSGIAKQQVYFTVDQEGNASFNLDGDPAGPFQIQFTADNTAGIEWNGQSWDGNGSLSGAEKASLEAAFESDLGQGLTSIPLLAACRSNSDLTPDQMAALLVPLQMKYKYLVSDRSGLAQELIQEYSCSSTENGLSSVLGSNLVQLSKSAPVPVVPGFFPFDESGAVEGEFSTTGSGKSACAQDSLPAPDLQDSISSLLDSPAFDVPGPCGALCRGACGADCDPDNCSFAKENRCEKDEHGQNTGNVIGVVVFECGLHQGCINHDDCYDRCNLANGCNTWSAAFCRHAVTSNPTQFQAGFCDQTAIWEEGPLDPALWMHGFGDMPLRKTYVYLDDEYGSYYNPGGCPIGEDSPLQPTQDSKQESEQKQPEDQKGEIQICDLLPGDPDLNPRSEYDCIGNYAESGGVREVQITTSPGGKSCTSLENNDYAIIIKELSIGDCGFQIEEGYLGTPGLPGYEGWGIDYVLGDYRVTVKTRDPYPSEAAWIEYMAHEVELQIREMTP